jgi:hypothetical protein
MSSTAPDPAEARQIAWSSLVAGLLAGRDRIATDVAADLGGDATAEAVTPVVERFLRALAGGHRLSGAELVAFRSEGAAAANAAIPLARPLDAYLSTAWVTWEHVVNPGPGGAVAPAGVLASLGAALLRAGDDIAAALADGYTRAERALAARAGATRRAVLDELLIPTSPGVVAQTRLSRRAVLVGLDPAMPYGLLLVRAATELEDEGPEVEEVARRLARDPARRPHLVSVRDGDLVVLLAGPWQGLGPAERAVIGAVPGSWWGVGVTPDLLPTLPRAYAAALDALRVAPACAPAGTMTDVRTMALERSLVADPELAAAGVERWLGPLVGSGRGGEALVTTLEAWLDEGLAVTGTARALGVAPRTVTYRLERAARLLGLPELDAAARERLATALLTRRLLEAWQVAR